MHRALIGTVLLFTFTIWAAPGRAEEPAAPPAEEAPGGVYVSAFGGFSVHVDSDLEGITGAGVGKLSFDAGTLYGGAVGWRIGNLFRVEGELAYRQYDADRAEVSGAFFPATGEASILSFMVNGYRDIPTETALTPYLGIGFGGASVDWQDVDSAATVRIDHRDLVFAVQFIAGVDYPVTPSFTVTGGYRLFGTSDPKFTAVDGTVLTGEVITHNFTLGVRYAF